MQTQHIALSQRLSNEVRPSRRIVAFLSEISTAFRPTPPTCHALPNRTVANNAQRAIANVVKVVRQQQNCFDSSPALDVSDTLIDSAQCEHHHRTCWNGIHRNTTLQTAIGAGDGSWIDAVKTCRQSRSVSHGAATIEARQ
jgi:hypothetical protein